jgi:hypothetical protein
MPDDVDLDELVSAPITYFDGRNNDFQSSPAEPVIFDLLSVAHAIGPGNLSGCLNEASS